MIRRTVRWLDERVGTSPLARKALRYVFPDHWSFLLGEIALYAFVVLVATGIYLTLFFTASDTQTVYHGEYGPLRGASMTEAYSSTLDLSFHVPAGLLMRQTHHWAALVFVVAIVMHLMRVFFTGAFRKPRDINYFIGVTMLGLAVFEGFAGYSLPDDLLSGMGLAIAYGVLLSVPIVGGNAGFLFWGQQFPGSHDFFPRLFITHVLILPVILAVLISIHLAIIMRQKHSQFAGEGRTERNVVGTPMWPGYALRSIGLMLAVFATVFLLGGLVQINPIWQWGPYEPYLGTNGAQPDWYLGWLIGALRLMPPLEIQFWGKTWVPNPFFGGALFPTAVFAFLYAWPAFERRRRGDYLRHDLLQRPRDDPWRTAVGAAFFSWVATIFLAGSADRILVNVGIPYGSQVWFFRITAVVAPVVVFFVTRRVCIELAETGVHPARGFTGTVVRRSPTGGYEPVPEERAPEPVGPAERP